MASDQSYLAFVLEQLSCVEGITYRPMMGEYLIYCCGKLIGGIYDDRFLIKRTKTAESLMPDAPYERPYDGAKEMLMVDRIDDKTFLAELVNGMLPELPEPKKK